LKTPKAESQGENLKL